MKTYEGIEYIVHKHKSMGNLCGYVRLPDDHPLIKPLSKLRWYKFVSKRHYVYGYDSLKIDCHGGLTFGEKITKRKSKLYTQGFNIGWWIGWDYSHLGDYIPRLASIPSLASFNDFKSDYHWTEDEVEEECHHVIDQLLQIKNNNEQQR